MPGPRKADRVLWRTWSRAGRTFPSLAAEDAWLGLAHDARQIVETDTVPIRYLLTYNIYNLYPHCARVGLSTFGWVPWTTLGQVKWRWEISSPVCVAPSSIPNRSGFCRSHSHRTRKLTCWYSPYVWKPRFKRRQYIYIYNMHATCRLHLH